ncbi:MAG TPA: transcriptional regulator NrdR [Candidatus Binatia bacterium]|nr:transcriptional regulator NrdR [Candidatus Binatia bacterium]
MRCPFCQSADSKVVDSRDTESGVRRRRECLSCGRRFTTYERIEIMPLWVIKKDGRREEFNRQKLLAGLLIASKKREIGPDQLEALVDDVENELRGGHLTEVSSQRVGEMVIERLRELDEIAYVRFASVYRSFKDVAEMRAEIEDVLAHPPPSRRPTRRPRPRGEGEELALDLGK